jgi:hypothetical protein
LRNAIEGCNVRSESAALFFLPKYKPLKLGLGFLHQQITPSIYENAAGPETAEVAIASTSTSSASDPTP